jgi:uncharacterized membrane protein YkoI
MDPVKYPVTPDWTPQDSQNLFNKMKLRQLPALICTALLAVALPVLVTAKEEKAAAGSIRPAHKVKDADLPALAKISFEDAMKAALAAVPGKIIKAELEVEDGSLMYSFEIVGADKSITEVEIDAGNGKVLDIDKEESGDEHKAEKK